MTFMFPFKLFNFFIHFCLSHSDHPFLLPHSLALMRFLLSFFLFLRHTTDLDWIGNNKREPIKRTQVCLTRVCNCRLLFCTVSFCDVKQNSSTSSSKQKQQTCYFSDRELVCQSRDWRLTTYGRVDTRAVLKGLKYSKGNTQTTVSRNPAGTCCRCATGTKCKRRFPPNKTRTYISINLLLLDSNEKDMCHGKFMFLLLKRL